MYSCVYLLTQNISSLTPVFFCHITSLMWLPPWCTFSFLYYYLSANFHLHHFFHLYLLSVPFRTSFLGAIVTTVEMSDNAERKKKSAEKTQGSSTHTEGGHWCLDSCWSHFYWLLNKHCSWMRRAIEQVHVEQRGRAGADWENRMAVKVTDVHNEERRKVAREQGKGV